MLEAGVPPGTADARVRGVMFTGSTEVATLLQRNIATRLDAQGRPIPLIAETGGMNAMIVDSSALTEQVVVKANIERHIQTMRAKGRPVFQAARENSDDAQEWQTGTFVMPTLIELENFAELEKEVFGPVLHVVRYNRNQLAELIEQINASGYGLTLGVHTRIDETIAQVTGSAHVGNLYVNRNMVDALNTTLTRQDARYPVDAQLKTTLLAPLTALTQWGRPASAIPGRCCRVNGYYAWLMMNRTR